MEHNMYTSRVTISFQYIFPFITFYGLIRATRSYMFSLFLLTLKFLRQIRKPTQRCASFCQNLIGKLIKTFFPLNGWRKRENEPMQIWCWFIPSFCSSFCQFWQDFLHFIFMQIRHYLKLQLPNKQIFFWKITHGNLRF